MLRSNEVLFEILIIIYSSFAAFWIIVIFHAEHNIERFKQSNNDKHHDTERKEIYTTACSEKSVF